MPYIAWRIEWIDLVPGLHGLWAPWAWRFGQHFEEFLACTRKNYEAGYSCSGGRDLVCSFEN